MRPAPSNRIAVTTPASCRPSRSPVQAVRPISSPGVVWPGNCPAITALPTEAGSRTVCTAAGPPVKAIASAATTEGSMDHVLAGLAARRK